MRQEVPQPGPSPQPTLNPLTADEHRQRDRDTVADALLAGVFASAISPTKLVPPQKLKNYRDQILQDAGIDGDPLQRMLAETVVVAHARILHLHGEAASAKSIEATAMLTDAAGGLMAEVRRCIESLAKTRSAATPKQSNVTFRVVRGEEDRQTSAA